MPSEPEAIEQGAALTALVLRDIAGHLQRGEAMALDGCWSGELRDTMRPSAEYHRRWYDLGRRQATADAVYALLRIAEMNDPAAAGGQPDTEEPADA